MRAGALTVLCLFGSSASAVEFNRDVRPILSDNCFQCHGNDEATRAGDLRLDVATAAAHVLGAGDPTASELLARITHEDPDLRMPPAKSAKTLTQEQIEILRQWIREGAPYADHWAFAPIQAVPPPASDEWCRNEIDQYVLSAMRERGFAPAPEADKVTLLRRVTFDLTGLPPTVDEVASFLADESPDAYERVVDRLMESPRYGEHKARYWLDAVRYGDTHGLHLDNYREMWPYRDWVISAMNDNLPYDRFVTEQLAGDLLQDVQLDQLVASGYNRCNISTNEGGSIPEEVYVRNVVDRTNTFGTVFLGLTVGCAQCHDHKYDPISQREYFELFAFFNNIDGNEMDGNVKDHAPSISVPSKESLARIAECEAKIATIERDARDRMVRAKPEFDRWLLELNAGGAELANLPAPEDEESLVVYLPLDNEGDGPIDMASKQRVGSVKGENGWGAGRVGGGFGFANNQYIELDPKVGNFKARESFSYGGWIRTPGNVTGAAIARMDEKRNHRGYDLWIEQRRVAAHLIGSWPQYAIKVVTRQDVLEPDQWHHVFVTYDGSARASGVRLYVNGKPQDVDVQVDSIDSKGNATISTNVPVRLGRRSEGAPFSNGQIDDVKIFSRELSPHDVAAQWRAPQVAQILSLEANQRTAEQLQLLLDHFVASWDKQLPELVEQQRTLQREIDTIREQAPTTLVFRERKRVKPAYVLKGGQYDAPGEKVERTTPGVLPPMADTLGRDRLGLAQWLTDPSHPLFSRVTVNRYWQQYFGTGLVKTPDNFGLQGEAPSHPELLDWLAMEFMQSGWDVKGLHRMIVTSATYRQSAKVGLETYRRDPENRWLAHGPRFRMDAEMLRDQALALSGLLVNQIGGPSVKPPQPDGLWEAVAYSGSNTKNFVPDTGDKVFRRSVYIFWKRTSPPPYLSICDAPSREEASIRRERTNTPLAALLMMNETQYFQSAIQLAATSLAEHELSLEERASQLFKQSTMRNPTAQEQQALVRAYHDFHSHYAGRPEAAEQLVSQAARPIEAHVDQVELAAWSMVANAILNLDEVVVKN